MLNKILFLSLIFSSTAQAADSIGLYGFGKSAQELGVDGFRSTVKSSGTQIYDKTKGSSSYKIVYVKKESVSRVYRENGELYMQYTKLDANERVLGQVQCKATKAMKVTSCSGQTANVCRELIAKVEAGGFDVDLKKLKECSDLSGKVNYSRTGVDELIDEGSKALFATNGAIPKVVKSTPNSLQTLMKDYSACKMVEPQLSEEAEKTADKSSPAESVKGTN